MSQDGRAAAVPTEATGVVSPCTRRCCLDEQDVCLGCGRPLRDILGWHAADDAQRRVIVAEAAARLAQRSGPAG